MGLSKSETAHIFGVVSGVHKKCEKCVAIIKRANKYMEKKK